MSVIFRRRGSLSRTVAVTITGSGNSSYCYATINGTNLYEAGTHEVKAGNAITFCVFGTNYVHVGTVTIDGTQVLDTGGYGTQTYNWTVPNGISTVEIAMEYVELANSTITVTTS